MEIIGKAIGVRGLYKLRDLDVFDGFSVYYNRESYLTSVNLNTLEFFEHIKRK